MLDHRIERFIYDHEWQNWTALCYCGWETEARSTRAGAKKVFNDEHCLAGVEEVEILRFFFNSEKDCTFCGNQGHTKQTCSRRPLLAI